VHTFAPIVVNTNCKCPYAYDWLEIDPKSIARFDADIDVNLHDDNTIILNLENHNVVCELHRLLSDKPEICDDVCADVFDVFSKMVHRNKAIDEQFQTFFF
jgi:hypothetical protein